MKTTEHIKIPRNGKTQVELIRGEYAAEEAMDIILNLIQKKIDFHEHKNLSVFLRTGKNSETSVKRIAELSAVKNELAEVLRYAIKENLRIKINSTVDIRFI